MSRSGYSEDCDDNWGLIMWRGRVASATKGKRGQQMLRDMLDALDALPIKELIRNDLEHEEAVCPLGTLGQYRGIDMAKLDPDDYASVAAAFDIAEPLAREIVYRNDEDEWRSPTPAERFVRMRAWVASQIKGNTPPDSALAPHNRGADTAN